MKKLLFAIILTAIISACNNSTPKPYGYFRIDMPQHTYVTFDSTYPPCIMEISTYSKVIKRKSKDKTEEWIDIVYTNQNGRIYCSYAPINNNFRQLSEDSRTLVYKHTIRADAIIEHPFENPEQNVYGILYEITGNAASPLQFVLTDSVHHFLRGSLYFNAVPNADSIAPVSTFIEQDMKHLVETIHWK